VKPPRIRFQLNPDPKFTQVAGLITKGDAPEWLLSGLAYLSELVGANIKTPDWQKEQKRTFEAMQNAADLLIKKLSIFAPGVLGFQCPDDIAVALVVLPKIRDHLGLLIEPSSRKGGPRPNILRKFCAAVVVEAWRLTHDGDASQRTPKFGSVTNTGKPAAGNIVASLPITGIEMLRTLSLPIQQGRNG
jgi:hypothetical protein